MYNSITFYEGDDCDTDIDGCAQNPCSLSRECTDLAPEEQTSFTDLYTCSTCPDGYEADGQDCASKSSILLQFIRTNNCSLPTKHLH